MPPINPFMENLPEEVMVDILTRLPVKTIIRCKSVCKKWHNLVNSSYFINLHFSRSPAGFMVYHGANTRGRISGSLKWVEIGDRLDHHSLHMEHVVNFDLEGCLDAHVQYTECIPDDSVNGLICIKDRVSGNIHICNPIIREYLTLPRLENYRASYGLIDVYNFGVNSLTGEYKVLRLFRGDLPPSPSLFENQVYTLGTRQWRSLGHVPYKFGGFSGTFLNSYFHWEVDGQGFPESIFTFDLDKETFQLFPSPPIEPGVMHGSTGNLGVCKGCLCRLDTYDFQLTIWVMKQYGIKESWHKELVITQAICPGLDWESRDDMHVLGGLEDGTILMIVGYKMLAYSPKSNTFEDLKLHNRWYFVMIHRPSFIKLKDIDSERVHTF